MNVTARTALKLIPKIQENQPVFLCINDTMVPKFSKKFENVSTTLFDHAAHNGSNYLNGHCFVSVMLCIPVWNKRKPRHRIPYLDIPLGYCMWQKEKTKLELAASIVRQVMPEFQEKRNVIILCDSWYVKSTMTTFGSITVFLPEKVRIKSSTSERYNDHSVTPISKKCYIEVNTFTCIDNDYITFY